MIKKVQRSQRLTEKRGSTNRSGRYQSIKVQIYTTLCELFVRRTKIMMKPGFLEQLRKTS